RAMARGIPGQVFLHGFRQGLDQGPRPRPTRLGGDVRHRPRPAGGPALRSGRLAIRAAPRRLGDRPRVPPGYRLTAEDPAGGPLSGPLADLRQTNLISKAMVRSPRTVPSVPWRPQHDQTQWQMTCPTRGRSWRRNGRKRRPGLALEPRSWPVTGG